MTPVTIKEINFFANKWFCTFRDAKDDDEDFLRSFDVDLGEDCRKLQFTMDCLHSFEESYGNASFNMDTLRRVINDVTDISLLTSAIYSKWRYYTHWVSFPINMQEMKEWFMLCLSRLLYLTEEIPFSFQGEVKTVYITSRKPEFDRQTGKSILKSQNIRIENNGCVQYCRNTLSPGLNASINSEYDEFTVSDSSVSKLLKKLGDSFSNPFTESFVPNTGNWMVEMTNTSDVTYNYRGSYSDSFEVNGRNLSEFIRETLDLYELYLFDGKNRTDRINKITLEYRRNRENPEQENENAQSRNMQPLCYVEELVIDRENKEIKHIQTFSDNCAVSHNYSIGDRVSSFLNHFNADTFFKTINENPVDRTKTSEKAKIYTIFIEYEHAPTKVISGSYYKNDLPGDFADFAEALTDLIHPYSISEMLDPLVFGKVKSGKDEYIICSVSFNGGFKTYYYKTDDDSINIGDYVMVPAGKDNHESIVRVEDIEYFTEEDAPLPVSKIKKILRKCSDADMKD